MRAGDGCGEGDLLSLLGADGGVISSAESHEEDNGGWSSFVSMTWAKSTSYWWLE